MNGHVSPDRDGDDRTVDDSAHILAARASPEDGQHGRRSGERYPRNDRTHLLGQQARLTHADAS
jgi:hypothetical protein